MGTIRASLGPLGKAGAKVLGFEVAMRQNEYELICSRDPFCNYISSFNYTEMVLHSKCAYGSQFSGENNELKIRHLVAEILTKKTVWSLCMHFLIFRGPKRQQFS